MGDKTMGRAPVYGQVRKRKPGPVRRKCIWCCLTHGHACSDQSCSVRQRLGGIGSDELLEKCRVLKRVHGDKLRLALELFGENAVENLEQVLYGRSSSANNYPNDAMLLLRQQAQQQARQQAQQQAQQASAQYFVSPPGIPPQQQASASMPKHPLQSSVPPQVAAALAEEQTGANLLKLLSSVCESNDKRAAAMTE